MEQAAKPRKRRFLDMNDTETFAATLITPAQLVLLLIIIFPLGLEVYISMTSWTPTKGGSWWEAYKLWDWGQQLYRRAHRRRLLAGFGAARS